MNEWVDREKQMINNGNKRDTIHLQIVNSRELGRERREP